MNAREVLLKIVIELMEIYIKYPVILIGGDIEAHLEESLPVGDYRTHGDSGFRTIRLTVSYLRDDLPDIDITAYGDMNRQILTSTGDIRTEPFDDVFGEVGE